MSGVRTERKSELTKNQILKGQHMAEETSRKYNGRKRYNTM